MKHGVFALAAVLAVSIALVSIDRLQAQQRAAAVAVDEDDIGGLVTGPAGPEAGVWVIAETDDLATTYRKIVVTDDEGRYLLPDLPSANFDIWVRGYGLVDSTKVSARPGGTLALTAVPAPSVVEAAQYYPANSWLSLLEIPSADEFPMVVPAPPGGGGAAVGGAPAAAGGELLNQGEFVHALKRGCQACHQLGLKATRDIPASLGVFDSSVEAWRRRLASGQTGAGMLAAVHRLGGTERGLAMFADWTDRIEAGEVPEAPPRPQGLERNLVITSWDYGTDRAFVHDIIASNKRNQTQNANGRIYGPDWSAGALAVLDPVEHSSFLIPVPVRNEADRAQMRTWSPQENTAPSPYWGDELVWNDPVNPNQPHLDSKGRVWFNTQTRLDQPEFCGEGSGNPFARSFPLNGRGTAKGLAAYDPATNTFELIDLCFSGQHGIFGNDDDETMYFSMALGIGWFNTRVWDETHDMELAQGWCPAVMDTNGDGRIGAYTQADEPFDPALDRMAAFPRGYAVAFSEADGAAWYVAGVIGPNRGAVPGKILRLTRGDNPPDTCVMEAFEPPFGDGLAAGEHGYFMQGLDIDTNGVAWTALAGSVHLASFDIRRCEVRSGQTATGQHCREGWTLHPVPGPTFRGSDVRTDFCYYNQVDLRGALGMGPDTPVINGTGSDALIAFDRRTEAFVTLRVPYPLGYYTRGLDARIDDSGAGWKGRGLWAANNNRVVWHTEGGRGMRSVVAKFQLRPDPLAR